MMITVNNWEHLEPRLVTADGTRPPMAICLLANALTGGAAIKTGWAEWSSEDESTVWRNWVITNSLFVYTEVEFPQKDFDSRAETDPTKERGYYVDPIVRRASAHSLESVTSLSIGAVGKASGHSGSQNSWYPIDGAVLTFADGATAKLPNQSHLDARARDASELFFTDLRSVIPMLG